MELQYTVIDGENEDAFRPYIMPDAALLLQKEGCVALGAVAGHLSCGAIVARQREGQVLIESLYVEPAMRRKKIGSMLLLQCLRRFSNWESATVQYCFSEPALSEVDAFFQAIWGGAPEKTSATFELTLAETKMTPFFSRFGLGHYAGPAIRRFRELSAAQLAALDQNPEIPPVLRYTYRPAHLNQQLSCFWVQQEQVKGYILVYEEENGAAVSIAAYVEKNANHGFFPLLGAMAKGVYSQYPDSTRFCVECIGSVSEGLASRMLGKQYCVARTHRQLCRRETPQAL